MHWLYLFSSSVSVAHQCPFALRDCGDVLAVALMAAKPFALRDCGDVLAVALRVAKVLFAAFEVLLVAVLEAEAAVVNPIVQRRWCQRRSLAAERPLSSPLRHVQVAELVGAPYGAMMPPTNYFASCISRPCL